MADMEDVHRVLLDGEQDSVDVRPTAVKKLPHLERKPLVFRGQATSLGEMRERLDGLFQIEEPVESCFPESPVPGVRPREWSQRGKSCFIRSSSSNSRAGRWRPARTLFVATLDARDGVLEVPLFAVEEGGKASSNASARSMPYCRANSSTFGLKRDSFHKRLRPEGTGERGLRAFGTTPGCGLREDARATGPEGRPRFPV